MKRNFRPLSRRGTFLGLIAALTAGTGLADGAQGETGDASHPLVAALMRYFEAREVDPAAASRELFASESRIWFEKKEGPGRLRGAAGRGPWADWDDYFNATSSRENIAVDGTAVTITSLEINDFYRLIERPPREVHVTYYFDGDGKVEGTLIRSSGATGDRFEEAKAWAREQRAEELEALMPEGEIVPSIDNAERWRVLLNEWRETVGLERID